jgi:hypothetical protein
VFCIPIIKFSRFYHSKSCHPMHSN